MSDYVRYAPGTFGMVSDGVSRVLVAEEVGRNGWGVIFQLCHSVTPDGRLARVSRAKVAERSGLTESQVSRGVKELRDKGIIEHVMVRNRQGFMVADRSRAGHVGQYRFTKEVWKTIERAEQPPLQAQGWRPRP